MKDLDEIKILQQNMNDLQKQLVDSESKLV